MVLPTAARHRDSRPVNRSSTAIPWREATTLIPPPSPEAKASPTPTPRCSTLPSTARKPRAAPSSTCPRTWSMINLAYSRARAKIITEHQYRHPHLAWSISLPLPNPLYEQLRERVRYRTMSATCSAARATETKHSTLSAHPTMGQSKARRRCSASSRPKSPWPIRPRSCRRRLVRRRSRLP